MTIRPEMKFLCDRCRIELNISLNDQPATDRAKSPEGWTALWIEVTTVPAKHLCGYCSALHDEFMKNIGSVP